MGEKGNIDLEGYRTFQFAGRVRPATDTGETRPVRAQASSQTIAILQVKW